MLNAWNNLCLKVLLDFDACLHVCCLSSIAFPGTRRTVNSAFEESVLAWLELFFYTDIFLQHSLGLVNYI